MKRKDKDWMETKTSSEHSPSVKQFALEVFVDAAPYLQHAEWVKEIFTSCLEEAETVEKLMRLLEADATRQEDHIRQADLRIYVAYLQRAWHRAVGQRP